MTTVTLKLPITHVPLSILAPVQTAITAVQPKSFTQNHIQLTIRLTVIPLHAIIATMQSQSSPTKTPYRSALLAAHHPGIHHVATRIIHTPATTFYIKQFITIKNWRQLQIIETCGI